MMRTSRWRAWMSSTDVLMPSISRRFTISVNSIFRIARDTSTRARPIFQRALNETRPLLVGSLASVAVFLVVWLPLIIAFGLTGFAAGFAATTAFQLVLRGYYLRRLFRGPPVSGQG